MYRARPSLRCKPAIRSNFLRTDSSSQCDLAGRLQRQQFNGSHTYNFKICRSFITVPQHEYLQSSTHCSRIPLTHTLSPYLQNKHHQHCYNHPHNDRYFSSAPSLSSSSCINNEEDLSTDSYEEAEKRRQLREEAHTKLLLLQEYNARIRKQERRRKSVARSIRPLLLITPSFYHDTMTSLNLTTRLHLDNHVSDGNRNPTIIPQQKTLTKPNSRKGRRKVRQQRITSTKGLDESSLLLLQQQNINRGLNSHYRQLYLDSLESFVSTLIKDPDSISFPNDNCVVDGDNTVISTDIISSENSDSKNNNSPNKVELLLDELVEVGFADNQFAKRYRKMKQHEVDMANFNQKLEVKQQDIIMRQEELDVGKDTLLEFRKEIGRGQLQFDRRRKMEREEKAAELESFGLWDKMIKVISDTLPVFNNTDTTNKTNRSSSCDETQLAHRRQVRHKANMSKLKSLENFVKTKQLSLQNSRNSVDQLQSEHKLQLLVPPLDVQDYQNADAALKRFWQELCPSFAMHIRQRHADLVEQYRTLDDMTDLTKPHLWYPAARRMNPRRIIFHGGNTNSGKTYNSLARLKEVERGLYLGPLRLLAAEVYEKITEEGLPCNLYTGQEYVETPGAKHTAATVEMAPTSSAYSYHGKEFDVVVLDEIQMISDPFRGFAWTRALQGIPCREIHVCGGMEALDIVTKMAKDCGDELIVKDEYKRFVELAVDDNSFSESNTVTSDNVNNISPYSMVEPGDCIVAFARNDIFAIKREIEETTSHKCCVIYGSLPPQIRVKQAKRFNDEHSGYDILIASDAIGMGLNLNIRRIIFNSMFKSNGEKIIQLTHSNVRQIGGRAGRRNSRYEHGTVTCRNPDDMEYLHRCMTTDITTVDAAGLIPTANQIESFSSALSAYNIMETTSTKIEEEDSNSRINSDLYTVLRKFIEMATLQGDYFMCRQTQMLRIAKFLANVPLSLTDKYTFCMAPVSLDDQNMMHSMRNYAKTLSRNESCGLVMPPTPKTPETFEDISKLCTLHNEVELFMWLCNRFPDNFEFEQSSLALQENIIALINHGLANSDNLKMSHCYIERDNRLRSSYAVTRETEMYDRKYF